jgi:hypothetical protein
MPDFGLVMVERGNVPHQTRLLSGRLSFSLPAGRQVCSFLLSKQKKGSVVRRPTADVGVFTAHHVISIFSAAFL